MKNADKGAENNRERTPMWATIPLGLLKLAVPLTLVGGLTYPQFRSANLQQKANNQAKQEFREEGHYVRGSFAIRMPEPDPIARKDGDSAYGADYVFQVGPSLQNAHRLVDLDGDGNVDFAAVNMLYADPKGRHTSNGIQTDVRYSRRWILTAVSTEFEEKNINQISGEEKYWVPNEVQIMSDKFRDLASLLVEEIQKENDSNWFPMAGKVGFSEREKIYRGLNHYWNGRIKGFLVSDEMEEFLKTD